MYSVCMYVCMYVSISIFNVSISTRRNRRFFVLVIVFVPSITSNQWLWGMHSGSYRPFFFFFPRNFSIVSIPSLWNIVTHDSSLYSPNYTTSDRVNNSAPALQINTKILFIYFASHIYFLFSLYLSLFLFSVF